MPNARHNPSNSRDRTVRALIRDVTEQFSQAGCDSPAFAAWQLLQHVTGQSRTQLLLRMEQPLAGPEYDVLMRLADRRAKGEPLQYLLGEWEFMGLPFVVGEGVLIPRPETELLCETVLEFLQKRAEKSTRVLDLCAGSGAVGIAVAFFFPQAEVVAVEKSEDAFPYLTRNIECSHVPVKAVQGDVLCPPDGFGEDCFDVIVSNPPYIPAGDLAGLQREVHWEPSMALDGGEDGLLFYRAILSLWTPLLKKGGLLTVECGIGQGREIAGMFTEVGLREAAVRNDLSGIDRVVSGIRDR